MIKKGETITVDGSSGEVLFGAADMVQPELTGDFGTLMEWADARAPHESARQRRNAARTPKWP